MLITRLGSNASTLCKLYRPTTCLFLQRGNKNMSLEKEDEDDKPISFSKSRASKWKAEYNRMPQVSRVWYTPHVVTGSVAIFLVYFCILREENDLDEVIYQPLPETLKGIEKVYPEVDFSAKPDYVLFHEENKLRKSEKTNLMR